MLSGRLFAEMECPNKYTQIAYCFLISEAKLLHACMCWQIIDRVSAVQERVREHSKGENGYKWEGCQVFKDYHEMLEKTTKDKKPDAMVIGVPPWLHGMHSVVWLGTCSSCTLS